MTGDSRAAGEIGASEAESPATPPDVAPSP
ncbi:MAG: hypothetical protein K0R97_322, partial [Oerskovia sp.]|nr:hypothetical protein [Oerskovia sp.]